MEITLISDTYDSKKYNSLVHHPLQSWEWGEARKKMGIEVIRMVYNNQAYQMTLHKIPYTSYKVGYIPRSPIPEKAVLDFMYEYGKSHKIIFIKIEPNVLKTQNDQSINFNQISGQYSISQSPHALFPQWSMLLDLNKSEDVLLKEMKPKTRYNIKLALKKNVEVKEESNEKGFKIFSDLYFETCKRQKYHGHTPEYHKIVWESLKDSMAHILIAYYENTPLAAYELFYFKKRLYYPYGGTSIQHRNVMAANLIMWESIKLGKKLGAESFDMWGSLSPNYPESHPWAGFTKFKEGYGAQFINFIGSFDLIINPLQYRSYNMIHAVRNVLLSMT